MESLNLDQEKVERLIDLMDSRDKLNAGIRLMLDGKRKHAQTSEDQVDKINREIKNYLNSKCTKEANSKELYLQFKSIFPDFDDFKKACVTLSREGYKIWL